MSVVLVSWGCESGHWTSGDCLTTAKATFNVPLTFTIYADNAGSPGDVLARETQTIPVLYRPSASAQCTGADAGKWYSSKDRACYNGFAQTVKMKFRGVTLPNQVIWSVAYNTTHYGYVPVRPTTCSPTPAGCGYDSLNVGTWSAPKAPFAGTDVNEDVAFVNSVYALSTGWTGSRPLGQIATN